MFVCGARAHTHTHSHKLSLSLSFLKKSFSLTHSHTHTNTQTLSLIHAHRRSSAERARMICSRWSLPVTRRRWPSATHRCVSGVRKCRVLQCVVVCCSVLQYVAVCCSVIQCVAVCCSVLQPENPCVYLIYIYTQYCLSTCCPSLSALTSSPALYQATHKSH